MHKKNKNIEDYTDGELDQLLDKFESYFIYNHSSSFENDIESILTPEEKIELYKRLYISYCADQIIAEIDNPKRSQRAKVKGYTRLSNNMAKLENYLFKHLTEYEKENLPFEIYEHIIRTGKTVNMYKRKIF
jgi:hypothetical protein